MLTCFQHAYSRPLFSAGDSDLVLVYDQGSLVGLRMQDYKSLCAAVTICPTLFSQMSTHTDITLISLFDKLLSQLS